jgi:hypothetical protein
MILRSTGKKQRMRLLRPLLPALFAAAVVLSVAAPASAAGVLEEAVRSLASDPVYVAPDAQEKLTAPQERRVENEIATTHAGPVYIALLPLAAENEAGGDPTEAVRTIAQDLHRRGTYAVVIGKHFRALSNVLPAGRAGELATEALDAHRDDGVAAVLVDFVDRVGDAEDGGGSSGGSHFSWWWLVILGGIGAFFFSRSRRRRSTEQTATADVRADAKEDLDALVDDVQRLETQVQGKPDAEAAYRRALDAYSRGSQAYDRARSPEELSRVAESLEEGRYQMAAAEALAAGRRPPERTPPCFFDPRHGPSTREVEWAPPGGSPRLVPACEADAQRVERGEEPHSRLVPVGGAMTPDWAAGPMYGGYFGGFLPGLLLGELLAGGWGWGGGYYGGGPWDGGGAGDGGGGFDSGDFGGGGFGGGDFGGGGGDFGGGGGGDF